jgi:hypothetical protein
MRKHRLAERLLTDVIGLDWELVHAEACRWEHVMSETVERRLLELLDHPTESPYGNPIPGLDELGETGRRRVHGPASSRSRDHRPGPGEARVLVRRISEEMQKDEALMSRPAPRRCAARQDVTVCSTREGVLVGSGGETAEIMLEAADHIFVERSSRCCGDVGDLVHRLVEGGLVGLRRLDRAAHLADVLQGGGGHLVRGGRRLEVVEGADVAAHASTVTFA